MQKKSLSISILHSIYIDCEMSGMFFYLSKTCKKNDIYRQKNVYFIETFNFLAFSCHTKKVSMM